MNHLLKGLAAAAVAVPMFAPTTAQAAQADSFCFAKAQVSPGSWVGTYAPVTGQGECDATNGLPLASHLTAAPVQTGNVLHIEITWQFFDEHGGLAFQTDQKGILNLGSGDVVLNGTVTQGYKLGSQTHDEGTPTDANGSYAGVMSINN